MQKKTIALLAIAATAIGTGALQAWRKPLNRLRLPLKL